MKSVTDHYQKDYHSVLFGPYMRDESVYNAQALTAEKNYFSSFPKPYGRVLEYGCGIGYNIVFIEGAEGYDVSREALYYCRKRGIKTIQDPGSILRNSYDYVLCRHVLEHVEQPLSLLTNLLSYLKMGGVLILVLPREKNRQVPIEKDIHQHLYCWNFRAINNLIFAAGGKPFRNFYNPTFGPETHRVLSPLLSMFGHSVYYKIGTLVGRIMGFSELVIYARRLA